jgi:hypothetical protein
LLEGVLASGHPAGLGGVFGSGGFWAVPAAGLCAGAIAVLLCGAAVIERVAATLAAPRGVAQVAAQVLGPFLVVPPRWAPLASCRAGRAPPLG